MRNYPTQQTEPGKGLSLITAPGLLGLHLEEGSEVVRDTKQLERELSNRFGASIACEPLLPTEAIMRPLHAGENSWLRRKPDPRTNGFLHVHLLMTHHLHASLPLFPTRPVAPEQWCRAARAGMLILPSVPLTLRTHLAGLAFGTPGLLNDA